MSPSSLPRICLFDRPGAGKTRTLIEEEIEALLAILDGLDGDADLELTGDDEPSLGWTQTMATGNRHDLELA